MDGQMAKLRGWKVIRTIGKGSFGCVYEVEKEDEFGGVAHSALKVISIPERDTDVEEYRQEGYDDVSLTAMFKSQVEDITSEFRLMSKLKGCSNIVSYEDHSIVQHDDDPGYDIYIRMELLTTLMKAYERELNENGYNDRYVQRVGVDICHALELCSRFNIIHRDIKPQNIFLNELGDFKLGDFGVAKTSDHTARATKTGTYKYMAPEVYLSKPYNASVDIYSLGLVLYWMMNERRGPFVPLPPDLPKPTQNAEALDRRMHGEPLPAPKNGSEQLKSIVLKACAYDPKDRYQSPAEMRRALECATDRTEEALPEAYAKPVESPVSAEEDEHTVRAFRGDAEKKETVFVKTEPEPVNRIAAEESTSSFIDTDEKTIGIFSGKAEELPVPEEDKTVGLFAEKRREVRSAPVKKEPEAAKPPVGKEPERKPEPAPKPEKTAGKGSKKNLLIIAAAAALAVIAAAVLIVVLASKGKPVQQAEAPTAAPTAAPTEAPTDTPTEAPTDTPTEAPTEAPTAAPTAKSTQKPVSGAATVSFELPRKIYQAGRNGYVKNEEYTKEMYDAYWAEIDKAWTDECREIVSYVNSKFADDAYVKAYFINSSSYAEVQANEGLKIAYAMVLWGFGTISEDKHLYNGLGAEWDLVNTFPDIKDFYNVTYAIYGGDIDTFYSKECAVKKDTTAHEIADTAFLNILPPITLSARFMLITGDDEILIIEGRTDPDATYYFVKPDYETVVERVSGDLKEGSFRYEIKISDSSFRGMTKAKIVAEKGSMKNFAEVVILRGFEAKDEFTKYYNKTKSYIEIPKTPIADILGNLTEYANGKYGFRITATVEKVFMQDGDTVVKMVISDTGETVYVRDYYQQWSPADHVGSVYRVYCNLVGTYENTGCGEFIGWIVKR